MIPYKLFYLLYLSYCGANKVLFFTKGEQVFANNFWYGQLPRVSNRKEGGVVLSMETAHGFGR